MFLRVRLDISWRDIAHGLWAALAARDRAGAQQRLERAWSGGRDDGLACLSVRSALDLFFAVLDLPAGAEVLYSAVTIPDMVEVARAHGLVPVPVDVAGTDLHVEPETLARAITDKSKALIVAHLFGARPEMHAVCALARERGIYVVEDCAQAWCGADWRGHDDADATLFSFGAIKTATALGGALARVKDPQLLARMRAIQNAYPVQSQGAFARTALKLAMLKAISARWAFGMLITVGKLFGMSIDDILGGLTRGFNRGDLMTQLRHQPCAALLRLLERRIETYDMDRIARRVANARQIIARLGLADAHSELADARHTYWLFGYPADDPGTLIAELRKHGFDSTQRGRLEVVPPPPDRPELDCPRAHEALARIVFLPCYPEMDLKSVDRMCDAIVATEAVSGASGMRRCAPATRRNRESGVRNQESEADAGWHAFTLRGPPRSG